MRNVRLFVVLVALLALAGTLVAQGPRILPDTINLGFTPESAVIPSGMKAYVGSIFDGAIWRVNLLTGESEQLCEADPPHMAAGLAFDPRTGYLFVAGAFAMGTPKAYVRDARDGHLVREYDLAEVTGPAFVNGVVLTGDAVYFTDSIQNLLYRLPLGPSGRLPEVAAAPLVLTGDYAADWLPMGSFVMSNANGIEATANGKYLLVVHSDLGRLYRIDPETGASIRIDLGGGSVDWGDGILLLGKTLYVVQNGPKKIAVVRLAADYLSGQITGWIQDEDLVAPSAVARLGGFLYVVDFGGQKLVRVSMHDVGQ